MSEQTPGYGTARCAIWARVSEHSQFSSNQLPDMAALAQRRDLEVVKVYGGTASAYKQQHLKLLQSYTRIVVSAGMTT